MPVRPLPPAFGAWLEQPAFGNERLALSIQRVDMHLSGWRLAIECRLCAGLGLSGWRFAFGEWHLKLSAARVTLA